MNIQGKALNDAILEGNDVRPEDRPKVGDVLSIFLSQQPKSAAVWKLRVFVQVAQGEYQVGKDVVTNPPSAGDPPSRLVACAFVPGAIGWKVTTFCETGGEEAEIFLQSSECCGAVFGVFPIVYVTPS